MERRVLEAAREGNIHELTDLIGSNELILEEMALKEAGHTLLHVACLGGHLEVVRELLKHMPKFAEKVDRDGFSPLHITAARGDVEIAEELLKVGTHLCSVKGWERRIPLHYAIINGEVDVMEILLSTSPESVEEKTAREETALHLAVKNNRFKVLVRLVEHLKQHKKEQVVDFLLRGHALECEVVEVNAPNESGLTPLDVSTTPSQRGAQDREITEILTRAGAKHGASRPVSGDDDDIEAGNGHQSDGEPVSNAPQPSSRLTIKNSNKDDGERWGKIEALLVVAGLIANATYQSVLQPPSIVELIKIDNTSRGSNDSTAPASAPALEIKENIPDGSRLVYTIFLGGNTFGFLVSIQIIIYLTKMIQDKKKRQDKNIQMVQEEENQERYIFGLIMLSMIAMVLTYFCFTLSLLIISTSGASVKTTVLHSLPLMIADFSSTDTEGAGENFRNFLGTALSILGPFAQ
ncbi:ankyrin repeat-containing protein BDA1 [Eucalyptus grandis]|uniref:ankyrin repeat-containing protein BDA1 n=1 Tax=Eucalyptus grandis TaxID=71139 RepID=UPI00192F112F|nr:ankyrin repeat-containing protein BDA1 [Eucalyptus grandis]